MSMVSHASADSTLSSLSLRQQQQTLEETLADQKADITALEHRLSLLREQTAETEKQLQSVKAAMEAQRAEAPPFIPRAVQVELRKISGLPPVQGTVPAVGDAATPAAGDFVRAYTSDEELGDPAMVEHRRRTRMQPACRFFGNTDGGCMSGSRCPYAHVLRHEDYAAAVRCSICEEVPNNRPKGYAVLDCCDAVQCAKCVLSWLEAQAQAGAAYPVCPLCDRPVQSFMCSSRCLVGNIRLEALEDEKERRSQQPCRRWLDSGCTSCPFGPLCWYQHPRPDDDAGIQGGTFTTTTGAGDRSPGVAFAEAHYPSVVDASDAATPTYDWSTLAELMLDDTHPTW